MSEYSPGRLVSATIKTACCAVIGMAGGHFGMLLLSALEVTGYNKSTHELLKFASEKGSEIAAEVGLSAFSDRDRSDPLQRVFCDSLRQAFAEIISTATPSSSILGLNSEIIGFKKWFDNWDIALESLLLDDFDQISLGPDTTEEAERRLSDCLALLNAQGAMLRHKTKVESLKYYISFNKDEFEKPPASLIAALKSRLPEILAPIFSENLTKERNNQANKKWVNQFIDNFLRKYGPMLDDIHIWTSELPKIGGETALLPKMAVQLAEIHGSKRDTCSKNPFASVPALPSVYTPNHKLLNKLSDLFLNSNRDRSIVSLLSKQSIPETDLAIALCHDTQIRQRFPDGIIWLKIGSGTPSIPDRCIKSLARTLDLDLSDFDEDTWLTLFGQRIREKVVLIALEDVHYISQIENFVRHLPQKSMVLFTTGDKTIASAFSAAVFDPGDVQRRINQTHGAYPYVSREFRVDDGPYFFGRDREVKQIIARLECDRDLRMCLLQGPSGLGKTSLLQAGLIHRLTGDGPTFRQAKWTYCLIKPHNSDLSPFRTMAQFLSARHSCFDDPSNVGKALLDASQKGNEAAEEAIREQLLDPLHGFDLILAIDQLEELWTKSAREAVDPFLTFLAAAAAHKRILILATLRDDYSAAFKNAPQIAPFFQQQTAFEYPLLPPSLDQIREIITAPAQAVDPPITFSDEAGFVDAISRDAATLGPAVLPLISLMLQTLRLPDRNGPTVNHFTLERYRELGSLTGIVRILAQGAKIPANPDQLYRLFEQLVRVESRGGKPQPALLEVHRDRLNTYAFGDMADARLLVERLVSSRLFYERDGHISIAYESLLELWDELKKWYQRNARALATIDEERQAATQWHRCARRPEYLKARGEKLDEIDDILKRNRVSEEPEDKILQDYLDRCNVRSLRDKLIHAVYSGNVFFAFAAIRKLRDLLKRLPEDKKSGGLLLDVRDRGTEPFQLKPAFWAAITGEAKPYDETKAQFIQGKSVFDGDEGTWEMARTTSRGLTPICWAAVAGQHELVGKLLERGDTSWKELFEDHQTAIANAAMGGEYEAISLLVDAALSAGIDPFKENRFGSTPMTWAIQQNHNVIVDYFIKKGHTLDFKAVDFAGRGRFDALTEAARGNNLVVLRRLLADPKWDPREKKGEDEQTALHYSCLNSCSDKAGATKALIADPRVDIHAKNRENYTPLHFACWCGKVSSIDLLIDVSRERGQLKELLNARDNDGRTPLHLASLWGKSRAVEMLISVKSEIEIDTLDNSGHTPFALAALQGHYRVVELLLDGGASTRVFSSGAWPSLCYAADDNDLEMIEILLRANDIDINLAIDSYTPLMLAVTKGHHQVVEALLKKGADPARQNKFGWSAVSYALRWERPDVMRVINEWAKNMPDLAEMIQRETLKIKAELLGRNPVQRSASGKFLGF